ncbi:hypothetical protein CARUB_v10015706mg [Capsella rubella]|uniref:Embryo surrounding factor 1 brassicaceae domain-containing protein n=1 Tax=Capsella rubella TaxID=81985 RepID=R0G9T7_9BRAS|nr:hypothetical protein CARUB_v10015706mg [Capsella rubella]
MKSSHIALISIIIFSIFTLHEGGRMKDGEIQRSMLHIHIPPCIKTYCKLSFKRECWCCISRKKNHCWKEKDYPKAKEICYEECSKVLLM